MSSDIEFKFNPVTCFDLKEAEALLNVSNSSILCINEELTRCKVIRNIVEAVDFYKED